MTIHVTISEAEKQLSQLVTAAVRGEEVVLAEAGGAAVRLTPVLPRTDAERIALVERRLDTLGIWKGLLADEESIVPPSMTDQELEESWYRKFGPAA
jgi:antitoxin (DNA-binding transcriptional repressor) of toxin-antitoxin stability system